MAKTNFTKVEEALAEGLRKMEVNRLLGATEKKSDDKTDPTPTTVLTKEQRLLIVALQHELKYLEKIDEDIVYTALKVKKKDIKKYLKDPLTIPPEQWDKLKDFRVKMKTYKEKLEIESTEKSNVKVEDDQDKFVEKERKSQKTKRFNINDKWIPLR